jgi:hypothetical protein
MPEPAILIAELAVRQPWIHGGEVKKGQPVKLSDGANCDAPKFMFVSNKTILNIHIKKSLIKITVFIVSQVLYCIFTSIILYNYCKYTNLLQTIDPQFCVRWLADAFNPIVSILHAGGLASTTYPSKKRRERLLRILELLCRPEAGKLIIWEWQAGCCTDTWPWDDVKD